MLNKGLTERILNLPRAIASGYAHPETNAFEELVSVGNLALVQAARYWRPDKGGSLSTLAFKAIHNRIRSSLDTSNRSRHAARWNTAISLEQLEESILKSADGDGGDCALAVDDRNSEEEYDNHELVEHLMVKLSPAQRACVWMRVRDGLCWYEIADRLQVSKPTAMLIFTKAILAMRKAGSRLGRKVCRDRVFPIQHMAGGTPQQRSAASLYRRQRARADHASGKLPLRCYYVVSDQDKVVVGPFQRAMQAASWLGLKRQTIHGRAARMIYHSFMERLGLTLGRGGDANSKLRAGYRLVDLMFREDRVTPESVFGASFRQITEVGE